MALAARLELRQGQQLVMTPQLQQAIRLLQLSNLELAEFVETELERNPLLEREETDSTPERRDTEAPEAAEAADAGDGAAADADEWLDLAKAAPDASEALDTDLGNVFPDSAPQDLGPDPSLGSFTSAGNWQNGSEEDFNLEGFVAAELSLKDHLITQLHVATADPVRLLIGQHLIDLVNEAGYLSADLGEIADKLGAPLPRRRPQPRRMPDAAAQGAEPLRPADRQAARQSRPARRPQSRRTAARGRR
jgi:RNA polymerase sigma-54 factor